MVEVTVMPTLLNSILFCCILSFFHDYVTTLWLFMVMVGICEIQTTNVDACRRLWR